MNFIFFMCFNYIFKKQNESVSGFVIPRLIEYKFIKNLSNESNA